MFKAWLIVEITKINKGCMTYTVYIIPVVGVSGTCIPIIKTNSHNLKLDAVIRE